MPSAKIYQQQQQKQWFIDAVNECRDWGGRTNKDEVENKKQHLYVQPDETDYVTIIVEWPQPTFMLHLMCPVRPVYIYWTHSTKTDQSNR